MIDTTLEISRLNQQVQDLTRRLTALESTPAAHADAQTIDRALDIPFTVSTVRNSIGMYTVELTDPTLITGTTSAQVTLVVDGVAQTGVSNKLVSALGLLSFTLTPTHQKVVIGMIPAGSTATLVSTVSGAGASAVYISALEILL